MVDLNRPRPGSPAVAITAGVAMAAMLAGGSAHALNILITNDDGVEASTVHALYRTLKSRGHDVIVASEAQDNSGKGGAADFFKPVQPLPRDSRGGAMKAGAPGVGTLPGDERVSYVDGTPVAAVLYGLDIVAQRRWHAPPDLVISGPNYGNNTGLVNNSSGTVNAALICINRGVPAIAVSTATPASFKPYARLAAGDPEYEDADIVVRIVDALDAHRERSAHRLLPPGLGLNVNIPAFTPGAARRLPMRSSRVGIATSATPVFVEDLSQDAAAKSLGLHDLPALPGVSLIPAGAPVGDHAVLADADPRSEQNVIRAGAVAISVIQGNHEAGPRFAAEVDGQLDSLLSPAGAPRRR